MTKQPPAAAISMSCVSDYDLHVEGGDTSMDDTGCPGNVTMVRPSDEATILTEKGMPLTPTQVWVPSTRILPAGTLYTETGVANST